MHSQEPHSQLGVVMVGRGRIVWFQSKAFQFLVTTEFQSRESALVSVLRQHGNDVEDGARLDLSDMLLCCRPKKARTRARFRLRMGSAEKVCHTERATGCARENGSLRSSRPTTPAAK